MELDYYIWEEGGSLVTRTARFGFAGTIPVETTGDVLIQSMASALGALLDEEDLDSAMFVLERLGQLEVHRMCPHGSVGFVAGEAVTADPERYA